MCFGKMCKCVPYAFITPNRALMIFDKLYNNFDKLSSAVPKHTNYIGLFAPDTRALHILKVTSVVSCFINASILYLKNSALLCYIQLIYSSLDIVVQQITYKVLLLRH